MRPDLTESPEVLLYQDTKPPQHNLSAKMNAKVYVGNLPDDVRSYDLEDIFLKYGHVRNIEIKTARGMPPFAFLEFDHPR